MSEGEEIQEQENQSKSSNNVEIVEEQKSLTSTLERLLKKKGTNLSDAKLNVNTSSAEPQNRPQRDSATEEDLNDSQEKSEDQEPIYQPMFSPKSNKPSEHITFRSNNFTSKNLGIGPVGTFENRHLNSILSREGSSIVREPQFTSNSQISSGGDSNKNPDSHKNS